MDLVSWADVVKKNIPWADIVEDHSEEFDVSDYHSQNADKQVFQELQQGTPIGIRSVQSILMSATQKSLSHFHTAGMVSFGNVISPSAENAMNSKYTPTNTSMKFSITNSSPSKIRGAIVGATLKSFVISFKSTVMGYFPERESIWYKIKPPSRDEIRLLKENKIHLLRFYIDYKKIQQYDLTLQKIASVFEQDYLHDCTVYTSPDFIGMMDVWFTKPAWLPSFLGQMSKIICGTTDILSCDVLSNNTTIVTTGSNIMELSGLPSITKKTITSNNVKDVERCFGIEAAAAVLRDITGSAIVSDFMTRTGNVLPFYKNTKETYRKGLLTSMGFERPKEDIKAALTKPSTSPLQVRTVYESIMTGMDPEYDFELYPA